MINRIRSLIGNRRQAARRKADINCSISVMEPHGRLKSVARQTPIMGRTRDLSASHLSLSVPAVRIGSRYLTAPDSRLLLTLHLPDVEISFEGVAQRYARIEASHNETSYFLAVKIKRISDTDRTRYTSYLQTLG